MGWGTKSGRIKYAGAIAAHKAKLAAGAARQAAEIEAETAAADRPAARAFSPAEEAGLRAAHVRVIDESLIKETGMYVDKNGVSVSGVIRGKRMTIELTKEQRDVALLAANSGSPLSFTHSHPLEAKGVSFAMLSPNDWSNATSIGLKSVSSIGTEVENGKAYHVEYRLSSKDGRPLAAHVVGVPRLAQNEVDYNNAGYKVDEWSAGMFNSLMRSNVKHGLHHVKLNKLTPRIAIDVAATTRTREDMVAIANKVFGGGVTYERFVLREVPKSVATPRG